MYFFPVRFFPVTLSLTYQWYHEWAQSGSILRPLFILSYEPPPVRSREGGGVLAASSVDPFPNRGSSPEQTGRQEANLYS